jgi:hypothetical protein
VPTARAAAERVPDLAPGHVLLFGAPVARDELDGFLDGSGGMVSTADDMARWLALQSTGEPALVSPAGLADTHTPPPGSSYAQGWDVQQPPGGVRRIEHTGVLSTYSAVQVLLPDSGYAFALLFAGNSALADTAGLADGLADLLTGRPPAGPRGTALTAAVLGLLTAVVVAGRGVQLARVRRWRRRAVARPPWRTAAGLAWLLGPPVLLPLLPALVAALADRSFTFWQLTLAMPDVVVLVVAAAAVGAALAVARLVALGAGRRPRSAGADRGRAGFRTPRRRS